MNFSLNNSLPSLLECIATDIDFKNYLVTIDVNDEDGIFSVSLIPHTIENITVGMKKTGDFVNIETDLFGKYVEKILKFDNFDNLKNKEKNSKLTMEFLQKNGF